MLNRRARRVRRPESWSVYLGEHGRGDDPPRWLRRWLSRRVLEGRFRKLLGHTPHDEIARVRFERARQLLRETRLPLTEVARRSGFRNAEYLSTAFRRQFGTAPITYRAAGGLTSAG